MADREAFISFLISAKRATYAALSDSARVDAVVAGSTQLEYRRGDWLYRDIYYGGLFFAGQEVIYWQSLPVWSMCYAGGMADAQIDKAIELRVNAFLKAALQAVTAEMPYRGPAKYTSGDLVYRNGYRGNVERFEGKEEIFFNGEKVYELGYLGGSLASPVGI